MTAFDYVIIALLIGGGEHREPTTVHGCVAVERLQARSLATGEPLWVFDPATRIRRFALSFRCEKAQEAPTS